MPAHLARPIAVDDWVGPDEIPEHMPTTINGHPPNANDIAEAGQVLAWSRHRRALQAWQREHPVRSTP